MPSIAHPLKVGTHGNSLIGQEEYCNCVDTVLNVAMLLRRRIDKAKSSQESDEVKEALQHLIDSISPFAKTYYDKSACRLSIMVDNGATKLINMNASHDMLSQASAEVLGLTRHVKFN